MDTFPRRNLPGDADQWGRALEKTAQETDKRLVQLEQTLRNFLRAFGGQAEEVANQVRVLAEVSDTANSAQVVALGKNRVFFDDAPPESDDLKVDDLWYNPEEDNKVYRWDGVSWSPLEVGSGALSEELNTTIDNAVTNALIAYDISQQAILQEIFEYTEGTNPTTPPTTGWSTTVPVWEEGKWIWARTTFIYGDESSETTDPVLMTGPAGTPGSPGRGIESTEVRYQVSTSGTSEPTGAWLTNPPAVPDGQYLWTRTVITYTDDTSSTSFSVSYHGSDAYTVLLSNEAHTFPGSTTAALAGSTISRVMAYQGATAQSVTIGTITGQVSGLTTSIQNNNSVNAQFTVTVTTSLTTQSGTLTIPVTVGGQTFTKAFAWSVSRAGATGAAGSNGSPGADGAPAQVISLTASSQVLVLSTGTSHSPATAVVTGTATNTSINQWQYSVNGGTFSNTLPAGVTRSGNVVTITGASLASSTDTVSVRMANTASGVFDVLTVARVRDGANGAPGPQGVSVSTITRYFRLAASTPAAPSNPPTSPWSTTEPNYTPGSTDNLYFVDRTVFSNGTSSLSSVQLSSTYAAAKAAYDLANNALTTANGKNKIIRSTAVASSPASYQANDMWWQYSGSQVIAMWLHNGSAWVAQTLTDSVITNLNAGTITAGVLNADRIGANSIESTKLLLQGGNMVPNPEFQVTTGWTWAGGVTPSVSTTSNGRGILLNRSVNGERSVTSAEIYVTSGTVYTVGAKVLRQAGSPAPALRLEIIPVNSAGVEQTPVVVATHAGTSTTWTNIYGTYTAPASTYRSVKFRFVAGATTATSGNDYLVQPRMFQAAVAEMIVDGAIVADKIGANQVTASKISGGDFSGKTFTGGTFTGTTFRTAASGQRLQFDSTGLRGFNTSNVETFRVGPDPTDGGLRVSPGSGGSESFASVTAYSSGSASFNAYGPGGSASKQATLGVSSSGVRMYLNNNQTGRSAHLEVDASLSTMTLYSGDNPPPGSSHSSEFFKITQESGAPTTIDATRGVNFRTPDLYVRGWPYAPALTGTTGAQINIAPSPLYGQTWQATDYYKDLMIASSTGAWRQKTGVHVQPAGSWEYANGTTAVGRTVNFTVPEPLESNETIRLTSLNVGSGFGFIAMSGITKNANNTVVQFRHLQIGSSTQNPVSVLWEIVPAGI